MYVLSSLHRLQTLSIRGFIANDDSEVNDLPPLQIERE